jgi:hypothetical protein
MKLYCCTYAVVHAHRCRPSLLLVHSAPRQCLLVVRADMAWKPTRKVWKRAHMFGMMDRNRFYVLLLPLPL